ncbi:MAG: hypothetical protein D6698_08315, partial [Gammaproteobacteria bacterium]
FAATANEHAGPQWRKAGLGQGGLMAMSNFRIGATIAAYPGEPLKLAIQPYAPRRTRERKVFLARGSIMPPDGLWAWRIVAENPRQTVWFAEPIVEIVDAWTHAGIKRWAAYGGIEEILDKALIECVAPSQSFCDNDIWVFARKKDWIRLLEQIEAIKNEIRENISDLVPSGDEYMLVITWNGSNLFEHPIAKPTQAQLDAITSRFPEFRAFCTERAVGGGNWDIGGPHGTDFEGHTW